MTQLSIKQPKIKLNLVVGEAYTDHKVIRRISWVDGIWLFYEVLSEELKNGTGRRLGYSVDGNPVYKCSCSGFRDWAKQVVQMDAIPLSPDAVPINLLGKIFKGRDGIVRWLCPSSEFPVYCTVWQTDKGLWANGWRVLQKPWIDCEILQDPPIGAEFRIIENGRSLTRVVNNEFIRREKTLN